MAKVKVGMAWRRDGNGNAHIGDLGVFAHADLVNEADVFTLAWQGAAIGNGRNVGVLSDMDLLVIPGGPHANATQIPVTGKAVDNAPKDNASAYADQRARSELDLIEQARTLGMPILALCGGSWRLVQNYGGQTVELAALGADGKLITGNTSNDLARQRHAGNMNLVATEFKHDLSIRPGSLVENATGRTAFGNKAAPMGKMNVNSVHWAVTRTSSMGQRPGLPARPFDVVPNNLLQVSAMDPSPLKTSEAVESRFGAPVLGVQWHPEYQLPQPNAQHGASRAANLALMQWMLKAGRAYRAHRNAMKLLLDTHGASDLPDKTLKTASGVRFTGAPVHTGDTGAAPAARVIPRHKEDIEVGNFGKGELAVRAYLFGLGRRPGKLFLTPTELFNLATGAPLSRLREDDELKQKPVLDFFKKAVGAQKYCSEESLAVIKKWPVE